MLTSDEVGYSNFLPRMRHRWGGWLVTHKFGEEIVWRSQVLQIREAKASKKNEIFMCSLEFDDCSKVNKR
jgi:hypothetical protein